MHYICTGGCDGESDNPGVCEAEFCSKQGKPLTVCSCEDGEHDTAGEGAAESEDA